MFVVDKSKEVRGFPRICADPCEAVVATCARPRYTQGCFPNISNTAPFTQQIPHFFQVNSPTSLIMCFIMLCQSQNDLTAKRPPSL